MVARIDGWVTPRDERRLTERVAPYHPQTAPYRRTTHQSDFPSRPNRKVGKFEPRMRRVRCHQRAKPQPGHGAAALQDHFLTSGVRSDPIKDGLGGDRRLQVLVRQREAIVGRRSGRWRPLVEEGVVALDVELRRHRVD